MQFLKSFQNADFDGHCVLYLKIKDKLDTHFLYTFGSMGTCKYVIYTNVVACILLGVALETYYGYVLCRSRSDKDMG